ncbi:hypothetical protein IAQ61_008264 [Plenodomus lingam]|uniref:uncharacterized protein n=1 Tax=Leptosphaeria maculans TaxID=5022 RepID=UPI00332A331F|nr:hypothetical protein IAQ61_008264 [Plenodomus lingam]
MASTWDMLGDLNAYVQRAKSNFGPQIVELYHMGFTTDFGHCERQPILPFFSRHATALFKMVRRHACVRSVLVIEHMGKRLQAAPRPSLLPDPNACVQVQNWEPAIHYLGAIPFLPYRKQVAIQGSTLFGRKAPEHDDDPSSRIRVKSERIRCFRREPVVCVPFIPC